MKLSTSVARTICSLLLTTTTINAIELDITSPGMFLNKKVFSILILVINSFIIRFNKTSGWTFSCRFNVILSKWYKWGRTW